MSNDENSGSKSKLTIGGLVVVMLLAALGYIFSGQGGSAVEPGVDLGPLEPNTSQFPPVNVVVGPPPEWYDIYFTNPTCPPTAERQGGLDEIVAEDIRQAEVQVDLAAFQFNSEPILAALISLEDRGIPVRVVIDTDYEDESAIRRLRRNGISVVTDDRTALMHNKFIVIDGRFTWTGSMNFTTNGVYCNNNNLVRIDSPQLANNYVTEMNEMYDSRSFGPRSFDNTPDEQLSIEGIDVENYFAPEKEVGNLIGELVSQAEHEILFMAFSFTLDLVGEPLLLRAEDGVRVRGVFETTGSGATFSYYGEFLEAALENVAVRQDGNSRLMHHKVIIIDRETVLFGSFNFSNSANDNNDENIVIVHDPRFTSFFVEEFETVWGEAKP